MKVIYRSIEDDILEAIRDAEKHNRTILKILLDKQEYEALIRPLYPLLYPEWEADKMLGKYYGVPIAGIRYEGGLHEGT